MNIFSKGDAIAISAPYHGHFKGAVYVYRHMDKEWRQKGSDINGALDRSKFGDSVAISGNGRRVIASGSGYNESRGYAQVYEYNEDGDVWNQIGNNFMGEISRCILVMILTSTTTVWRQISKIDYGDKFQKSLYDHLDNWKGVDQPIWISRGAQCG